MTEQLKTPTIRGGRRVQKIYVVGSFVFVPHPEFHGVWIRTDHSVAKVICAHPSCGAEIGVPCKRLRLKLRNGQHETISTGYSSTTHYIRRRDAKGVQFPFESSREIHMTITK